MTVAYLFTIIVCLIFCGLSSAATNQTKAICYSGSSIYQLVTQNCNDKDSSYTGEWFCAKMEICENFISSQRSCVVTRGCATEQECRYSSSTTGYYDGNNVQLNGQNPGGMTVTVTCCSAYDFPDDDTVAIDYSNICNAASANFLLSTRAFLVFLFVSFIMMM